MILKLLKYFESNSFKWLILICFTGAIGWLKWNHIFERDESQVLLIVNNNRNFFDLIKTFGYEGTTGLWHVFLWLLSWIIPINPISVSIIHFFVIAFFVWLFLFKIEIPMMFKLIFIVQLSVLWHSLYVRQYVFILLFLAVYLQSMQTKKYLWINLSLFLLAQVHVTAIPIAFSLWIYYLASGILKKEKIIKFINFIPVAGFVIAFLQILPPSDLTPGLTSWNKISSLSEVIFRIDLAISEMLSTKSTVIYFILIPAMVVWLIRKSFYSGKIHLLIWILSFLICFAAFIYISLVKYLVVMHYSLLLYTLLVFVVLLHQQNEIKMKVRWNFVLIPLFAFSAWQMRAKIADYLYAPFSYAKETAEFLDEKYPCKTVLIIPETHYNSVRVYRKEKTPVFSLGRNDFSEYTIWNHHCVDHKMNKGLLPVKISDLKNELLKVPDSILISCPILVIGSEMPQMLIDENGSFAEDIDINDIIYLKYIRSFDGNALNFLTEKYMVFEVQKKKMYKIIE
ncbi:MAG: hypothetical protein ABIJ97_02030 [Bacteroidota bacterium]